MNTEVIEKPAYTFRRLNSKDTFLMFRILSKIGLQELLESFDEKTIKQITALSGAGADKETASNMFGLSIVLNVANAIINNIPKCEDEIFQMLSNTSNLSIEQVQELDFVVFAQMIIDFIKKEEFKDFFMVVSGLFKSEK